MDALEKLLVTQLVGKPSAPEHDGAALELITDGLVERVLRIEMRAAGCRVLHQRGRSADLVVFGRADAFDALANDVAVDHATLRCDGDVALLAALARVLRAELHPYQTRGRDG